ncbi:hypothetical protein SAMN06297251_1441, partial [Fulvimarina manganoxydans]
MQTCATMLVAISRCTNANEIDRLVSVSYSLGLSDADLMAIDAAGRARRAELSVPKQRSFLPPPVPCRSGSRPRSASSMVRRRQWAASGWLPARLAGDFTAAMLAVLSVVAERIAETGQCVWPLGRIAARAGVSRSTAKAAIRAARIAGLLVVEERRQTAWRNLPNIVRIAAGDWLAWIKRRRPKDRKGVG